PERCPRGAGGHRSHQADTHLLRRLALAVTKLADDGVGRRRYRDLSEHVLTPRARDQTGSLTSGTLASAVTSDVTQPPNALMTIRYQPASTKIGIGGQNTYVTTPNARAATRACRRVMWRPLSPIHVATTYAAITAYTRPGNSWRSCH